MSAHVQVHRGHAHELLEVVRTAWAASHARQQLRSALSRSVQKLQELHMTVFPSIAWATRHWTTSELQGAPNADDPPDRPLVAPWYRDLAGHTSRWAEEAWHVAQLPWALGTIAFQGTLALERAHRGVARCLVAQDVAWHPSCNADVGRMRLGRGHRTLGLQQQMPRSVQSNTWHENAQNRDAWESME